MPFVELVQRNRLRCYGRILRTDNDRWVRCIPYDAVRPDKDTDLKKIWKQVVDKDMAELHIKPSYAMDHGEWKEMMRGNWNDSISDSKEMRLSMNCTFLMPCRLI